MFSPDWHRPPSVEYPSVWKRFDRTLKDGKTIKFKVQDATEDMYDEILEFMCDYYFPQEPWNVAAGCSSDPISIQTFKDYIKKFAFPQKVTLVCLLDEDDAPQEKLIKTRIIGCNLTGIACVDNDDGYEEFIKSKPMENLLGLYLVMKEFCPDISEKYKVSHYLTALGLCVHPEYRGYNLSVEILSSRIPLCKAIGIKLTNTMFTATPSQKTAAKAGFIVEASVKYSVLSKESGLEFPIKYEECKDMSLVIE